MPRETAARVWALTNPAWAASRQLTVVKYRRGSWMGSFGALPGSRELWSQAVWARSPKLFRCLIPTEINGMLELGRAAGPFPHPTTPLRTLLWVGGSPRVTESPAQLCPSHPFSQPPEPGTPSNQPQQGRLFQPTALAPKHPRALCSPGVGQAQPASPVSPSYSSAIHTARHEMSPCPAAGPA
ncbi:ribosome biogenesis protein BOP1 [Platysternon megacephalum]|uniref:Ribosome biogenesis protein BOP1 n=1 Tax=Platysternon megacephalum TaxID=55544 RepID=A0A4D9DZX4_9SAUR|nr:ribosome biogenesis protein BOP1 [Platysternon megacephalum]